MIVELLRERKTEPALDDGRRHRRFRIAGPATTGSLARGVALGYTNFYACSMNAFSKLTLEVESQPK